MMVATDREVYPNAPLQYVACEVRFPFSTTLADESILPLLHRTFYDWLPFIEPGVETTVVVGPQGGVPSPSVRTVRFLSRDRMQSVMLSGTQVVIETTNYERYELFRVSIERALAAIASMPNAIAAVSRIGLRYIDEIRVPKAIKRVADWHGYVAEGLIGPRALRAAGAVLSTSQGTLQFEVGTQKRLVMRYGAVVGQAVGNAPLRLRRGPEPGPYFLVDIDSFWTASEPLPHYILDDALGIADELHKPTRELFEASITERLRTEVLRRNPDGD